MAQEVFISHSTRDKAVANAVVAALEREGISCWIAPRNVLPGADWGQSLIQGIRASRVFVLLLSSAANSSRHILREVERAVHMGIPIVPLRIEEVVPEGALEFHLSTVHWLDAFTPPVETHLRQLVNTLLAILERERQQPAPAPAVSPGKAPEKPAQFSVGPSASRQPAEPSPSPGIGRQREIQKDVPPEHVIPTVQKRPPYMVFSILAALAAVGLAYWSAHRPDPLADLRQVDWSAVKVDDAHFADCKGYSPCNEKKSQSELLKQTDWLKEPYNSPLFKDCMGYSVCIARRDHAEKLVAVKDWAKVGHDDAPLLKDCMNYAACVQAAVSLRIPLPTKPTGNQDKCSLSSVPSCCQDDACRKCKETLHILYQDCKGVFKE
jgi:TIR domain